MKICLAQVRPVKGNIQANIDQHVYWIERAASLGAGLIVFSELSIIGYEPSLSQQLATTIDDSRFDIFQVLSDSHLLTIGLGVPIRNQAGISISLLFFEPHQTRHIYGKKYLHPDEEPFFVPGRSTVDLSRHQLALAICYELTVPAHAQCASASGARIYLASVAKSAAGIQKSKERLANIARTYGMTTLLVNCVGACDGFVGAGQSFVMNKKGK